MSTNSEHSDNKVNEINKMLKSIDVAMSTNSEHSDNKVNEMLKSIDVAASSSDQSNNKVHEINKMLKSIDRSYDDKSDHRVAAIYNSTSNDGMFEGFDTVNTNNDISQDNSNTSCNLLGIDSSKLSDYKKKFYSMYKHQIECPKNCGLSKVGTRDCYMDKIGMKKCGIDNDKDCQGIFTSDYNNPDVYALGYLALDQNNSKPCATCTSDKNNNLNRSSISDNVSVFDDTPLKNYSHEGFRNMNNINFDKYEYLSDDTKKIDEDRMLKKNISDANVSNYVNFENNVYQNSIGVTPVDKMAEIRTCTSGTCGLKSYGKNINNAYDKLLNTPAYTDRNSCNPNSITGILEDAVDNYSSY